jgi:hypothetical protein
MTAGNGSVVTHCLLVAAESGVIGEEGSGPRLIGQKHYICGLTQTSRLRTPVCFPGVFSAEHGDDRMQEAVVGQGDGPSALGRSDTEGHDANSGDSRVKSPDNPPLSLPAAGLPFVAVGRVGQAMRPELKHLLEHPCLLPMA